MPDERIGVPNVLVRGRWCARAVDGTGTLFIEAGEVVLRLDQNGEELATPLHALSGAAWRSEVLTLHGVGAELEVKGSAALDRAWYAIMRRACAAPEVARGLRSLGRRHGGEAELRARFFGPLLRSRRSLEEPELVDMQVARFDAPALAERYRALVTAIAAERRPRLAPHRRALEAELADAAESLFARLRSLEHAGAAVRAADDAARFVAWRVWSAELRALFVEADRSWGEIVAVLTRAG
jgi:hypothetical protein